MFRRISGIRTNKGDAVKSSRSTFVDWGLWQKCAFALSDRAGQEFPFLRGGQVI